MDDSILLVDDDPGVLSALKRSFMDEPYTIYTASGGAEGLDILATNRIKLVISDEKMPGMAGSEFLAAVKKMFPHTIRIMLTGNANIDAAMKAINSGEIYRFFTKPWDDIELKISVRTAIERYDLEEENRTLLKTVKKQACELQQLEKSYPGITNLKKDEEGNVILSEIPDMDRELSEIMAQSEAENES